MSSQRQSRMTASSDDPFISVHALGEFIYCPRAGMLAVEGQTADGDNPVCEGANLRFLPRWSLERIKRRLADMFWRIAGYFFGLQVLLFTAVMSYGNGPVLMPVLCLVGVAWLLWRMCRAVHAVCVLSCRWGRARHAKPSEPDQNCGQSQPVGWWSLLNAGFESVSYKDLLRDEHWRIAGRPWRVLRKGSLRIPVIRLKGKLSLRRQHYARIAAYCHLLETCEGAESPYGVVVQSETYEGKTIPNVPGSRKLFHDSLVAARQVIQGARKGRVPSVSGDGRPCWTCPLGTPLVYRRGITETTCDGRVLPPKVRAGVDGRCYHSSCGDRFGWVPPHEKAYRKQLR